MEISQKLKIIGSFLSDPHKVGNEYLYYCPFCSHHKKKLSLNFFKGKFKCWVCDAYGNIRKLVRSRASQEQFSRWKMLDGEVAITSGLDDLFAEQQKKEEEILSLPENFTTLTANKQTTSHIRSLNYLKKRGLTKEDILYWKIGFCYDGDYKNRIVIPSFNTSGDLNYFIGRGINGSVYPKYKLPEASKDVVFNELYLDFDKEMVVTEGIFDAIKAGQNSVPLLGSTIREESRLFQKVVKYDTTVFMALDPDAMKKENAIIRKFIEYGVEVYKINVRPFKDVGEMSKPEFKKRKEEAVLMTNTKILEQELGVI